MTTIKTLLNLPARNGPAGDTATHAGATGAASAADPERTTGATGAALCARSLAAGVTTSRSLVSLPGARAFFLDRDLACGPEAAFQAGTEFAHIHAPFDGSLHVTLPEEVAREAIARGWGEPHLVQKGLLIFGPRDEQE